MKNFETLRQAAKLKWAELVSGNLPVIYLGTASCGRAAGALEVLQAIRELPGQTAVSKLVAITDFGEATRGQIELVQKLLAADPKFLPNGREVSWVFFLDITRYPQMLPESSPEMFDVVKNHLIVLPPLRERLADLATYLKLHLDLFSRREGDAERAQLSPEAVSTLLGYAWPGNYLEVVDVARRVVATEHVPPLAGADAAKLLATDESVVPDRMESYLIAKQREFIAESARRAGVEPVALLKNFKIDPALLGSIGNLDDLSLIYPELIPGA